jgi:hypothetical protein
MLLAGMMAHMPRLVKEDEELRRVFGRCKAVDASLNVTCWMEESMDDFYVGTVSAARSSSEPRDQGYRASECHDKVT